MDSARGRGREAGRPVALLTIGFRPFYLLAGAFAGVAVPIWQFAPGELLPAGPYLAGAAWHAHEIVFGFAAAVLTGFLLTAARAWSGLATPTGLAACGAGGALGRRKGAGRDGAGGPGHRGRLPVPPLRLPRRARDRPRLSVERAYARSDMIEKRRVLMQQWADFMAGGAAKWYGSKDEADFPEFPRAAFSPADEYSKPRKLRRPHLFGRSGGWEQYMVDGGMAGWRRHE